MGKTYTLVVVDERAAAVGTLFFFLEELDKVAAFLQRLGVLEPRLERGATVHIHRLLRHRIRKRTLCFLSRIGTSTAHS